MLRAFVLQKQRALLGPEFLQISARGVKKKKKVVQVKQQPCSQSIRVRFNWRQRLERLHKTSVVYSIFMSKRVKANFRVVAIWPVSHLTYFTVRACQDKLALKKLAVTFITGPSN